MSTSFAQEVLGRPDGALILVGGGHMGAALAQGWRAQGWGEDLLIIEQDARRRASLEGDGFTVADELTSETAARCGALVVAVKPKHVADVAATIAYRLPPQTLVISVAAGVTLLRLQALFPEAHMVRAMPNTAAVVGQSATAYVAASDAPAEASTTAEALLGAVGTVIAAPDEAALHAVTALSGSGPAYVYLLTEAMAATGVQAGLPVDMAEALARQTVLGAGRMLEHADAPPGTLRAQVTSPNGTTQAALDVLTAAEDGMPRLLTRAMRAAMSRSRELAAGG